MINAEVVEAVAPTGLRTAVAPVVLAVERAGEGGTVETLLAAAVLAVPAAAAHAAAAAALLMRLQMAISCTCYMMIRMFPSI